MKTTPNAISLVRATAVVPVVLLLSDPGLAWWALGIFCAGALTDALDGLLARRLGAATPLGAFLDPLADKILILGTLAALLGQGVAEAGLVLVIFGRESVAIALRSAGVIRGVAIDVSPDGKAKTVVQAVAVALLLLSVCVPDPGVATLAAFSLVAAAALTVASGAHLLLRAPLLLAGRERVAADAR